MLRSCFTAWMLASPAVEPLAPGAGASDGPPPRRVAPLEHAADDDGAGGGAPTIARPLDTGPRRAPRRVDPKALRMVRFDLLLGPLWRVRTVDTHVITSVEYGRMHGFSAAFHTAMIVATPDRGLVSVVGDEPIRAYDFPIGFGAIARGRLRERPLYGSIGLTVGILVHRASTERGVIRRVDPDFRLPIRLAWTAGRVGLSLTLEQGYSVRERSYERRGAEVWARHAYRVGFAVGLHSDLLVGRRNRRPRGRGP